MFTNLDLADILGRTDFDFDKFFFICWTPDFWISRFLRFPKSGPGQAWAGLGQAVWGIFWTTYCLFMEKCVVRLVWIRDFQVPRFPDFQATPGLCLGLARAVGQAGPEVLWW